MADEAQVIELLRENIDKIKILFTFAELNYPFCPSYLILPKALLFLLC